MADIRIFAEPGDNIIKISRIDVLGKLNSGKSREVIAEEIGISMTQLETYIQENFSTVITYKRKN